MALTGKQRAFADAVLIGKNNKEAAIAAGYKINSAGPAGSRLAKHPAVVAYIAARRGAPVARQASPAPPQTAPDAGSAKPFDLKAVLLHSDPRDFLLAAMNDGGLEPKLRIDAAKALMPFEHPKQGEGSKKDQKGEAAKKAASKFTPTTPPKLKAVK
jgi:phage terminase small subunit